MPGESVCVTWSLLTACSGSAGGGLHWPGRSWAEPVPETRLTWVLSFTGLYRWLHLPDLGPQLHWPVPMAALA